VHDSVGEASVGSEKEAVNDICQIYPKIMSTNV